MRALKKQLFTAHLAGCQWRAGLGEQGEHQAERAGSFSRGQSSPRLLRSYMLIPTNEPVSNGASAAARQRHTVSGLLQGEFYQRLI